MTERLRRTTCCCRSAVLAAVLAAALLALPASSSADSCLFQGLRASPKNVATVERSLLCVVNLYRAKNALDPLSLDTRLGEASRRHSEDMYKRNYFDHQSPEGEGPAERGQKAGYDGFGCCGENIAYNSTGTAYSLFEQWRHSPGHNANMLEGAYHATGVGVYPNAPTFGLGGIMGTQMFAYGEANTQITGFALYASNKACADAKLTIIRKSAAVRRAKRQLARATTDSERRRLRAKIRRLRREISAARAVASRQCDPPPAP